MGCKFEENTRQRILSQGGEGLILLGIMSMGLGILSCIIYFFSQHESNYFYDAKLYFGIFFISFGSFSLLIGCLSYFTSRQQQKELKDCKNVSLYVLQMCCLFQFLIQIIGVSMIAAAILGMNDAYKGGDDMACRRVDFMRQSHRLYKLSETTLCHQDCPCYIEDKSQYNRNVLQGLSFQDLPPNQSYGINTINIMNCPQYPDMIQRLGWEGDANMTDFITSMELAFNCAGICNASPMYIFSDVNRGPPQSQNSCFEELVVFTDKWGYIIFFFYLFLTCALILILIASCQYCCCKRNQPNENNNYRPGDIQQNQAQNNNIPYQQVQNSDNIGNQGQQLRQPNNQLTYQGQQSYYNQQFYQPINQQYPNQYFYQQPYNYNQQGVQQQQLQPQYLNQPPPVINQQPTQYAYQNQNFQQFPQQQYNNQLQQNNINQQQPIAQNLQQQQPQQQNQIPVNEFQYQQSLLTPQQQESNKDNLNNSQQLSQKQQQQ